MDPRTTFGTANDLTDALGATGYLADDALATITWLALRLGRPLLMEGEPGTGKTALAEALAETHGPAADPAAVLRGHRRDPGPLRLGLPAPDPPRAGARGGRGRRRATCARSSRACSTSASSSPGPVLRALRDAPARAAHRRDRPGRRRVRGLPARGALDLAGDHPRARHRHAQPCPPVVVLTSNRTRELHDALKRRCLYHWLDHPGIAARARDRRAAARPRSRPRSPSRSSRAVHGIRADREMLKPPGRRRDPRLGPGPARARHPRARHRDRGRHPRGGGEVPRGRRAGQKAARRDADPMTVRDHVRAQAARGAAPRLRPRPARRRRRRHRRPRAHLPRGGRGRRPRRRSRRSTTPGRATLCASPADLERYDLVVRRVVQRPAGRRRRTARRLPHRRCAQAGLGATEGAGRRGRRRPGCRSGPGELDRRCCATATSRPSTPPSAAAGARLFGEPPTRARRAAARAASRHPGAAPSTPAPPCARAAAPDGRAGRGPPAPPRHPGRARSSCSSTSPGR